MNDTKKNELEFPCEVTMKVIFRNIPNIRETVKCCLNENDLSYSLDEKTSNNSTFLSFTLTADFSSKEKLDEICSLLKSINGYQMMF